MKQVQAHRGGHAAGHHPKHKLKKVVTEFAGNGVTVHKHYHPGPNGEPAPEQPPMVFNKMAQAHKHYKEALAEGGMASEGGDFAQNNAGGEAMTGEPPVAVNQP